MRAPEPRDEADLMRRAAALAGRNLGELAASLGSGSGGDVATPSREGGQLRAKGKTGELLERLLGAEGGSAAVHDFPRLGIELKSIPVDLHGKPRESTYVCTISLADADAAEWATSWARAKLAHVLWVPVVAAHADTPMAERRVGEPLLWRPSPDEEATLKHDFDEIMGAIGAGGIEGVTARLGRALQVRPKAQDGRPRAIAFGREGERIATVPRGFYLRATFTARILAGTSLTARPA